MIQRHPADFTPEQLETLLRKYDRPGPRYTSYPTAPAWSDEFGPAELKASLERLGVDRRRSTDEDFDAFVEMGIDIIRIHVFDSEISDGDGNLIENDHLDGLDYLVAQCNRKGIYLMLKKVFWVAHERDISTAEAANVLARERIKNVGGLSGQARSRC